MTAEEWDVCGEPYALLGQLVRDAWERKGRLFRCACCRLVWHLLADPRSRRAVEVAERHADGLEGDAELEAACAAARPVRLGSNIPPSVRIAAWLAERGKENWSGPTVLLCKAAVRAEAALRSGPEAGTAAEQAQVRHMAGLIHCIFGNPFRPSPVLPTWRTWNGAAVVGLARAAYEERHLPSGLLDNDRLLVLADALEEAGCADPNLLGHLRAGGDHARGCFVVDSLLARS